MALQYTPSTEKVARSYERTAQMVPNLGVSALAVVNGSVKIEQPTDAAATLSSPLAGMHLRRNSMSYSVRTRRSRGGVKLRINRRRRSRRRLSRNVNYALLDTPRFQSDYRSALSRRLKSNRRRSRRRLSRNVNYAIVSNRRGSRRRLSRNVNYAIVSNRRRRGSRRRLSRNVNYAIASNRRRRGSRRRLSRNVNYALVSNSRRSRSRKGR
jgi:hypothetical protein